MKKRFSIIKIKSMPDNLEFPYNKEMLKLLKQENKVEQEYYYVEDNNSYAYIIVYKMKMNLFTYGKRELNFNTSVIGYPCSLSEEGYVTNDQRLVLEFAKTIKGPVLILNAKKEIKDNNYVLGETLPTCVFKNNFKTIQEYLSSLRSNYRRRINIAIKNCNDILIKINPKDDIYELYLNTYNKSNYKLEKLERDFFKKVDAYKLVFYKENKAVGFVLLKLINNKLIFMLCGMDYSIDTTDLYYYMLFNIIKYGIENNVEYIDFGQTSEETKLKLGAKLEKRFFYARHSNKLINSIVKHGRGLLEYKYNFPDYNVIKEERNESSII